MEDIERVAWMVLVVVITIVLSLAARYACASVVYQLTGHCEFNIIRYTPEDPQPLACPETVVGSITVPDDPSDPIKVDMGLAQVLMYPYQYPTLTLPKYSGAPSWYWFDGGSVLSTAGGGTIDWYADLLQGSYWQFELTDVFVAVRPLYIKATEPGTLILLIWGLIWTLCGNITSRLKSRTQKDGSRPQNKS